VTWKPAGVPPRAACSARLTEASKRQNIKLRKIASK
jgi:hypothetical protein